MEFGILAFVFMVTFLGEFGIPFPFVMQGLLISYGYRISTFGVSSAAFFIFDVIIGSMLGSVMLYVISRLFGNRFLDVYKKYRKITQNVIDKIKSKLVSYTILAVTLGRLTPGFLVPISAIAGIMRFSFIKYFIGSLLSILIWNGMFLFAGILLGYNFPQLGSFFINLPKYLGIIVIVSLMSLLIFKINYFIRLILH